MSKLTRPQQQMATELINRFDYIGKLDAIKYLKETFNSSDFSSMIAAYNSIGW